MTKKGLPTKREVLDYVRTRGEVTNDEMYRERYGDVERGMDTVRKLRELADEGEIRLVVRHRREERPGNPSGGPIVSTVIEWRARGG